MTRNNTAKRLEFFERNLTLWVLTCMVAGIALGKLLPDMTRRLAHWEFGANSHVNVVMPSLFGS